jgi:hypothetical protein
MQHEHCAPQAITASGRSFSEEEVSTIVQMVAMCAGLSRFELAQTVCELLQWRRANGALKTRECRDLLERLEVRAALSLPAKRSGRPKGRRTSTASTDRGECRGEIAGALREVAPVELEPVREADGRALWRELLARYHYLGYATPFGAQLVYLIRSQRREGEVLGGLTYTSPAWRMQARDAWIGWDEVARKAHLGRIVNQGRFLILPWVRVRHLASHVLALGSRRIALDWQRHYGVRPWLLETLVDPARFAGTCYRAANWREVGETSGRGRMDREHQRHGRARKRVFLYPLHPEARERLRGER